MKCFCVVPCTVQCWLTVLECWPATPLFTTIVMIKCFIPNEKQAEMVGEVITFKWVTETQEKRHLSSMAAESLSLSLPVVKVVCEHSRRSKGFWQETDGAVKIACYSHSLPLYLLYGSPQLISGTVYSSQVQVCRKAGSQPAAHIWETNYESSGERKKERVKYDSYISHGEDWLLELLYNYYIDEIWTD